MLISYKGAIDRKELKQLCQNRSHREIEAVNLTHTMRQQ